MSIRARLGLVLTAVSALCLAPIGPAAAQEQADQTDRADPPDPLPTLDELLGTDGGASDGEAATLPEEGEEELDRLLSGQEIVDEFRAAADLMDRSARRLTAARDTGIGTQRMQEDVLRKLDKLIADAQERSQQNSNSSSSSSSDQQQQQQQQPRQENSQQAGNGENRDERAPPGGQNGPLGPEQAADLAAWGALPARLRDALVQGSSDRFSATYRKLTEAYYRRLAEEPKQ